MNASRNELTESPIKTNNISSFHPPKRPEQKSPGKDDLFKKTSADAYVTIDACV